jgi:hypothetical protein
VTGSLRGALDLSHITGPNSTTWLAGTSDERGTVLEPTMAPQPAESPRNPSSRCQGSGPRVSLCRRDVRPLDSASPPCCRCRPGARMVLRARHDRLGLEGAPVR